MHMVIIVGGAVSGSEAAHQFALRGVSSVVIEQNDRPYGKVEDGLPRWHVGLRRQEEKKIDEKLSHPLVHFVPRTKIGRDIALEDLVRMGSNAVIFANGAWRDRALPVPGVEAFAGRGFWYQNPLIYWFNHYTEDSYDGPGFEPADGALVVGGGLASLDVVKVLMLETVQRTLASRRIQADLYDLEHRGIPQVLQELGLTLSGLGLRGCTLIYRRNTEDMPVAGDDDHPEKIEQTRATRRKLLGNFVRKYLFQFQDLRVPVGFVAGDGCLQGLVLSATEAREGRVARVAGSEYEFRTPLVISSIGSIPEPIPGFPMQGETYLIRDERTGEVEGFDCVFAIGNAVTGRGNILASRRHGRVVSEHMLENYLTGISSGYEEVLAEAAVNTAAKISAVAETLSGQLPLPQERIDRILRRVRQMQEKAGYSGNYREWVAEGLLAGKGNGRDREDL